ncbi:MAG: hypothetical protein LBC68_06185 [Prevotellaceae bacterium]|jgi:hypothetical protein|nr:hypothetical protein [Prevotellaceae bacterium]
MKKIIFITVTSCLLLVACGGGKKQNSDSRQSAKLSGTTNANNDLQKERIYGSVDSVRQRVYWCLEKFGRMEKGRLQNLPQYDFLKVFDKYGFLTEEIHYNSEDKVISRKTITYNDAHQPLIEDIFKGDELDEHIVYTYDEKMKLAKKEKFGKDNALKEKVQYIYYKDSGLLMDEDWYKSDGTTLSLKYVHLYENTLLSEKQKYWGGGSLAQKEYYTHDDKENLILYTSEKYQNQTVSFDKQISYSDFDSFGDYHEKITYDNQGDEIAKSMYIYDKYGNLTMYQNLEKKYVEAVEQIYNENENTGNEETDIDTDEENTDEDDNDENSDDVINNGWWELKSGESYSYEYDSFNNWTQKITYKITSESERTRQFYYERKYHYR